MFSFFTLFMRIYLLLINLILCEDQQETKKLFKNDEFHSVVLFPAFDSFVSSLSLFLPVLFYLIIPSFRIWLTTFTFLFFLYLKFQCNKAENKELTNDELINDELTNDKLINEELANKQTTSKHYKFASCYILRVINASINIATLILQSISILGIFFFGTKVPIVMFLHLAIAILMAFWTILLILRPIQQINGRHLTYSGLPEYLAIFMGLMHVFELYTTTPLISLLSIFMQMENRLALLLLVKIAEGAIVYNLSLYVVGWLTPIKGSWRYKEYKNPNYLYEVDLLLKY